MIKRSNNNFRAAFIILLFPLLFSTSLFAATGREIMQMVDSRDDGDVEFSVTSISTCKTRKKEHKVTCAEKPRFKRFESIRKDYGKNGKDIRSVIIILDPPAERGVGFLQYDYAKRGRVTDQWIYFSALGKIKRIASANENEPKKGSFFGSEILYEDMESRNINNYNYKFIKEDIYQKRPCWIIESIPTDEQAGKSNYSRSFSWIDKERLIVLKTVLYDRQGRKAKRIVSRQVERVGNIWIAKKTYFNNLYTSRMSILSMNSVRFNITVTDDLFTQRTLIDGAFRELNLQKLRQ